MGSTRSSPSRPARGGSRARFPWVTLQTAAALPALLTFAATAAAGDLGSILHGLTAPVRSLHRQKPATCHDDQVDRLVKEIDWVERHIDTYGSIVAKHPDIWGQSRLTRHRHEYEEQMQARLGAFQELNNASLRRSDQAFLGMALTMGQTPATAGRAATTTTAKPVEATATVTNLISNPTGGATAGETVISRTAPFAVSTPFAPFGLDANNAIGLEPTIHLDHLSRYLNHLNELRRINEGDDIADSPGYSLNLVRMPVSILTGAHTQAGHGAEITVIAEPTLGPDLLPTTFRSLAINDLVDLLAPGLTFAVNVPAVRAELQSAANCCMPQPAAEPAASGDRPAVRLQLPSTAPPAAATGIATAAAVRGMRSQTVSVPTAKMRRARMPLPPEQLVDVIGQEQMAILLQATVEALAAHPVSSPCIDHADVRGFLAEELQAACDFLAQERQQQVWSDLPGWNLAELVRSRRGNELELRRRSFFASLGTDEALPDDSLPVEDLALAARPGEPCVGPCANTTRSCRLCRTTTAVLAWAILVESALLSDRLADDMRDSGLAHGPAAAGACSGPFYGPHPGPESREAFNDYVRRRWPIRVFALDPVSEEQNVEDQFAQRREIQVAMALAFASGRANGQALARYARRLESDMATIALNKTAVGFTHGNDTFGWRFYPRVQSPPPRGNLAAFTDTLCGARPADRDLASRRLEPGMRECTAIIVMPSFVPLVTFDVRTNWFSLTHPRATDQSMRQAVQLSRAVKAMQQTASRCGPCSDPCQTGDLARLLRRVDQLDRELPLQTMLAQIPYENTAGGFELFNSGLTDLAPELIGWYGAQGVDADGTTTVFVVGKGFSVHETSVVAGGRPVKASPISRQLLRVEIPPGVQTIVPAAAGSCGQSAATIRRRHSGIVRVSNAEPLPAPAGGRGPTGPSVHAAGTPSAISDACGCSDDCHGREVVDLHVATPHGVSGHLLIPVMRATAGESRGALAFAPGNSLRLTATQTKAGTWRVNEFYESAADAIAIDVPAAFAPPARAAVQFVIRDNATGATAGTFSIPAPPFDARGQRYLLAGADLRNFIGDTSRPATDKTLRGAVKPYLDSLGTGTTADGRSVVDRDLAVTAQLLTEQKPIPIEGAIVVEVRRQDQAAEPDPAGTAAASAASVD
jgi:hypothetical protein